MKVYIVIASIIDSGYQIYGVFDSEEKAEKCIADWDINNDPIGYAWDRKDFWVHEEDVK